jgi:uncharacterized membrane protein
MDAAPEIVAVSAAREVTDRARAMEALSDKRPVGAQLGCWFLFVVVGFTPLISRRLLGIDGQALDVIMVSAFAALVIILLALEIYYLRRRVTAITYLLLEQERKSNRP